MNIGFITIEYPHSLLGRTGGIGTSIKNLATELVKQGHVVTVLVLSGKSFEVMSEGLRVIALPSTKISKAGWFLNRRKLLIAINRMVKEESLAIVEAPDWGGLSAGIIPDCPLVIRCHGTDTYFGHLLNYKPRLSVFLAEKLALKQAHAVASVSSFTKQITSEIFGLNNVVVIPNGVDTLQFAETEVLPDGLSILYFGTLVRKKGLLDLAKIFSKVRQKIPGVRLKLVGADSIDKITGSSSLALFKSLLSAEDLRNVECLGAQPYNEIKNHIALASVCVFPSYAECLPLSWIEAMLMQKAIVASNIGWAPEMIQDGASGFLVHPTKHEVFAERICLLLTDKKLAERFGNAARESAQSKYDIKIVAQQTLLWYDKVIAGYKK